MKMQLQRLTALGITCATMRSSSISAPSSASMNYLPKATHSLVPSPLDSRISRLHTSMPRLLPRMTQLVSIQPNIRSYHNLTCHRSNLCWPRYSPNRQLLAMAPLNHLGVRKRTDQRVRLQRRAAILGLVIRHRRKQRSFLRPLTSLRSSDRLWWKLIQWQRA